MRTVTIISNHRPLTIALATAVMSLVFVRTVGDGSIPVTALQSIRLIHQAQTFHYSQYGRYARSMQELRPLILDDDLATGVKDGYRFQVRGSQAAYEILAEPLNARGRSFYSDQTMVIRQPAHPLAEIRCSALFVETKLRPAPRSA